MGKKILLADDSITIQKVIELTFSDEDFEVVTVGNGRLAIEKVADVRPDVVLCDIIMPEKDGYEVCDFIKKNPALSHIPVLLLTGAFEPFDQERAARVGCDGFLAKPFEPQTLIAKVKDLLSKSGSRAAASAGSRPMPSPPPARPEPLPEPDEQAGFPTMVSKAPPRSESPALDDRFYAGGPVTPPPELTPVTEEEAESLGGAGRKEDSGTAVYQPGRAPWSQPTIEVPLETRAQAGVSAQAEPEPLFEEVFDAEPTPPPLPAAAAPPAAAPPASSAAFESEEAEEVLEEAEEEAEPWRPAAPTPPPWAASPAAPPAPAPATWKAPPAAAAPWTPAPAPASFADVSPAPAAPAAPPSQAAEVPVPADMVEKIAQRVVAQISEKVVREVAWEVIPDLAEALIKKEIERLKAELQQT